MPYTLLRDHPYPEPRTAWFIAAAGLIRLPRVYRDIVCAIPVWSLVATSIYRLGALCSGWYRLRFNRVVGLVSLIFHLC